MDVLVWKSARVPLHLPMYIFNSQLPRYMFLDYRSKYSNWWKTTSHIPNISASETNKTVRMQYQMSFTFQHFAFHLSKCKMMRQNGIDSLFFHPFSFSSSFIVMLLFFIFLASRLVPCSPLSICRFETPEQVLGYSYGFMYHH